MPSRRKKECPHGPKEDIENGRLVAKQSLHDEVVYEEVLLTSRVDSQISLDVGDLSAWAFI
jgi:hypothetical protein